MKLTFIDIADVQSDIDQNALAIHFNTSFHTAKEAPDLPVPSNEPTSFSQWAPFILRSRGLPESALQIVTLTRSQMNTVVLAARASINTRQLSLSYAEDLREEVNPSFEKLIFPTEGLFMRLGACSPKDGTETTPGKASLHSVDDIMLRLTTSQRAWSALTNILNTDANHACIYFLPFDKRMRTEAEYRVFCMPSSLRITAVSQYKWHKRWIFAQGTKEEMEETALKILDGIEKIHAQIVGRLHDAGEGELLEDLQRQGFTFDVLHIDDKNFMLIELNTFGVRSQCGSCLFQWVKDRDTIYGVSSKEVEFRVAR
ncbi:hypothetical protein VFPPC_08340 [Pochonia chlamydosporia 170]|uniref:Cell division cycle protein 123 n=1 Tax=Pochonia chlamydosporia 170 TaxID=1380566 RepID=A0A179FP99_METCM|nr:hypothetical protein VFPPC_08340 [Pochonia chlamydosporia 170]OAQ66829.1 hypothetical protein VFPPC_08340 [Pochonia chlamydosporia 170]